MHSDNLYGLASFIQLLSENGTKFAFFNPLGPNLPTEKTADTPTGLSDGGLSDLFTYDARIVFWNY